MTTSALNGHTAIFSLFILLSKTSHTVGAGIWTVRLQERAWGSAFLDSEKCFFQC